MNSTIKQTKSSYRRSKGRLDLVVKRIFDCTASLVGLLIMSPLFLVMAVFIMIEDGRPVVFKQKRSGIDDTTFDMYKFRSMKKLQVHGKYHPKRNYGWKNGVPDDFIFKVTSSSNPNITKVGKFIRKYSLDELPQLVNVLKGEMSIVGPRPEILEISTCYNREQQIRLQVKPGITGWAQVNGRSDLNHGEKIRHDLYYVRNFTLWLDIKIIVKTIRQVFVGEGSV